MPAKALSTIALLLMTACTAARAEERCEKKCYEAETCPIVGTKCLKFTWCRDVCDGKGGSGAGGDSASPDKKPAPAGPLPGPKTEI